MFSTLSSLLENSVDSSLKTLGGPRRALERADYEISKLYTGHDDASFDAFKQVGDSTVELTIGYSMYQKPNYHVSWSIKDSKGRVLKSKHGPDGEQLNAEELLPRVNQLIAEFEKRE